MKKKLLSLLLVLLPMIALAEAVEIDGIYYTIIVKSKTAEVTQNPNTYQGDIIIPETIVYEGETYTVSSIGKSAFSLNSPPSETRSITIPKTIKSIGSMAFFDSSFDYINIQDLAAWCNISFDGYACNPLSPSSYYISHSKLVLNGEIITDLVVPNTVSKISDYAFNGAGFKSVEIPSSVVSIGQYAFQQCDSLTTINIPAGTVLIDKFAFDNCPNIISVSIANSVKYIKLGAFWRCNSLKELSIGSGIRQIENNSFAECPQLENVYCYAQNPPETDAKAFENSMIEYAKLYVRGSSIESYSNHSPWNAFKEIVKIDIPTHKLIYIVDGEEYKSYQIEEGLAITPEEAPTKEGYTFSGWSDIPETMPANDVTITGSFSINKYKLTYMVDGAEYKSYDVEYGASITPEETPTKEGYTFSGWSEIPETMPANDVTVTGTFSINKYKLTYMVDGSEYKSYDVEYGAAITPEPAPTKEGYTFSGWSDIPATMPANDVVVTGSFSAIEIKEETGEFTATSGSTAELSNDNNVSGEYEIPETVTHGGVTYTVTSIGNEAFKDNTSLTDVTIPSTITSIGESAFAGCSNLKSITVNSTTPIAFPSASRTRSGSSVFEGVDKNTCVLYVPEGCVEAYKAAPVWGEFANILVIGTSSISGVLFDSGKQQDIYSLDGRKVKSNATSAEGLPKGVYIINGKKVLK